MMSPEIEAMWEALQLQAKNSWEEAAKAWEEAAFHASSQSAINRYKLRAKKARGKIDGNKNRQNVGNSRK